jgi:hypothetical protein
MKFVKFKEQSCIIAENQPEYLPIPAHQVKDPEGTTFMRIQFDPEEIEQINKTGGIWMSQLTFNKPVTPFMVYAKSPFPYLQPISSELSAIYFKDINAVIFYTPDGQPIKTITHEMFGQWYPVEGFNTFSFYRIKQVVKPGIITNGEPEYLTHLHISYDTLTGGSKLLNNQLYYKDDDDNILEK